MNTSMQLVWAVALLCTGFLLALILDIYRAVRNLLKPRQLGTVIGDVIYASVASIIVWILFLSFIEGRMRFMYLVVIAVGMLLYRFMLGYRLVLVIQGGLRRLLAIADKVAVFCASQFLKLGRILAWPLLIAYKVVRFLGKTMSFIISRPVNILRRK